MKTRFIYFILGILAAVAVSSCEGNFQPDRSSRKSVTIGLRVAGINGTKAEATEEEAKISSIDIFIVNSDKTALSKIGTIDYNETYGTATFDVPSGATGTWYLYVFANASSTIVSGITDYASLKAAYTGTKAQLGSLWTDNAFLMTNVQTATSEESTPLGGVGIDLDLKNPTATVVLERVASKVTVNVSKSVDYSLIGTTMLGSDGSAAISNIELSGVALFNCVNTFNYLQRWTEASSNKVLVSPSYSADYALSDYYDYDVTSLTYSAPGTDMYCLENNSPVYSSLSDLGMNPDATASTKMKGRVTGLIFKFRFKTATGFTSEGINEDLILDENTGEWKTKAGSTDADYYTIYRYNAVCYADQKALFNANNGTIGALTPGSAPACSTADLRANGVEVFENGTMYFTYYIQDPNVTDGTGNHLCMVRNTHYDLTLDAVTRIGDDVPGGTGYNRVDPISTNPYKITVTLKVVDWDEKTAQDYTI